jgi:hypothetical protein
MLAMQLRKTLLKRNLNVFNHCLPLMIGLLSFKRVSFISFYLYFIIILTFYFSWCEEKSKKSKIFPCKECNANILKNVSAIFCDSCLEWFHMSYEKVSREPASQHYVCITCRKWCVRHRQTRIRTLTLNCFVIYRQRSYVFF